MSKAKVYFTKEISPAKVLEMYKVLGVELPGKVAVKVHSGEKGNQNFLGPEYMKPTVDYVKGTIIEANTAYPGARRHTADHLKLLKEHGWSEAFNTEILDAEGPDLELPITKFKQINKHLVGKGLGNYDSLLVLSHFKGHGMGGFGGALKQLSIGCGSSEGKAWIHSAGKTTDPDNHFKLNTEQKIFCEAMGDAATGIVEHFGPGKLAFVNIMKNLSVDCDCVGGGQAEAPCMADIGILSSLDPVAIDQACVDLVYGSDDPGRDHMIERIESRLGIRTIEAAAEDGAGSREYELICID